MSLEYTTPVPNRIFDLDLASLKEVELKVLLVIVRKTLGWVNENNPRQRKQIQRIPIKSFEINTGCSRRGISSAIQSLIQKELIKVFDFNGKELTIADDRKGKYHLYFQPTIKPVENHYTQRKNLPKCNAKFAHQPKQNFLNTIKENIKVKKEEKVTQFLPEYFHSATKSLHISSYMKNYKL